MAGEDQIDRMNEEDEFRTPQRKNKKQKKRREIATETENHEEGKTITVRVKQIYERPDRISPIVAYFSTGYDPNAIHPETGEKQTPEVTVYRHKDESKKRLKVVVSPPGANVEFVGTNYSGEQAAMQTTTNTIAVFNRETKTLRILPIACNKIIRLEPVIKNQEAIDPEASGSAVVADPKLSIGQQLSETTHRYSTKQAAARDKKKRALNMGDDDAEAQKSLDQKLSEVDVNTAALESTISNAARNIPPYDASATTPEKAYPLEKIIEKGEWNFLEDVYRLLQQETSAATDAYPVFVRNRLYKLRDIEEDTEKKRVSGVLTLLTHFVKFKDMNSMNGIESTKDHRLPIIIRQKCQRLFMDPESQRIPVDKANLLISYVLVLALHVDNFETDPEDIGKDLRMSTVDLRRHFENLGCGLKKSKEKSTVVATLKTPLKFEEIRRRKRTRK